MKTVLIITYYWPPSSGPGVQRWLKMATYLPEYGIRPIILTVKDGSYPSRDESLLDEVPDDLQVIHTKTLEPFQIFNTLRGKKGNEISVGLSGMKSKTSFVQRFGIWLRANFFIPDARKAWKSYALKAAEPLMTKVDAIITTGPPHSTHAIGKHLKENYGKPWLVDMRDPWSTIHYHDLMPMWDSSLRKHKKLEDGVLINADSVTVVSEGMKSKFSDRRTDIPVIFNGFDESDFDSSIKPSPHEFSLSYVGNLKPNQNVPALWRALGQCLTDSPALKKVFKLRLIGKKDPEALGLINEFIPPSNLELIDQVSHAEAVKAMCSSHLLLFIIPKSENNKLILTGKLFEYLASGRPIFSIGPKDGDASKILNDCKMPSMLNYEDGDEMQKTIMTLFNHKTEGVGLRPEVMQYSRRAQTKKLAEVLDKLIKEQK